MDQERYSLNNVSHEFLYYLASFLKIEDVLSLQKTNKKLSLQCHDANIYKNIPILWNAARYLFQQNLSSSLFDKVESLIFYGDESCGSCNDIKEDFIDLKSEHIDCNINQNWSQSIKTLKLVINNPSYQDINLLNTFATFENIETMLFAGTGHEYHHYVFIKKLNHSSLQKLDYQCGEVTNEFLLALSKCVNLEEILFDENYVILPIDESKYDVYKYVEHSMSTHKILQKIKLPKLRKISIASPDFVEQNLIKYTFEIVAHLIKTAYHKIDLDLDFIEVCNARHVELLFGHKNSAQILPKIQTLTVVGWTDIMIELLKLLSFSNKECMESLNIDIHIKKGLFLIENKDKFINDVPRYIKTLLSYANIKKVKISFFLFIKQFFKRLLQQRFNEKNIKKIGLFEVDMIPNNDLLWGLLAIIKKKRKTVDMICDNIRINIVGITSQDNANHKLDKLMNDGAKHLNVFYHQTHQCFTINQMTFEYKKKDDVADEFDTADQYEYIYNQKTKDID